MEQRRAMLVGIAIVLAGSLAARRGLTPPLKTRTLLAVAALVPPALTELVEPPERPL
jgi:hypothetical protein